MKNTRTLLEQAERAARRGKPIAENLRTSMDMRRTQSIGLLSQDFTTPPEADELFTTLRDGRDEPDMFTVWSDG